jgi:hypothetical protein
VPEKRKKIAIRHASTTLLLERSNIRISGIGIGNGSGIIVSVFDLFDVFGVVFVVSIPLFGVSTAPRPLGGGHPVSMLQYYECHGQPQVPKDSHAFDRSG